jgi:hypothetical protein
VDLPIRQSAKTMPDGHRQCARFTYCTSSLSNKLNISA